MKNTCEGFLSFIECLQETIQMYEKSVSLGNTILSPYPRRIVDVPAPD